MKAKKLLFLPLLGLSMVFFTQCTEDPLYSITDDPVEMSALKKGPGGGGHPEVATNNLSFPALALDGFLIPASFDPIFSVPYAGDYPGLTDAEIADRLATGPWYAQKVPDNKWQAAWASPSSVNVNYIDWGDVIESVNPKLRRPFRLEVTLYKNVGSMKAFKMALLEYPSSMDEVQGTNKLTYFQQYATVVSGDPKLVLQYIGTIDHEILEWDPSDYRWKVPNGENPPIVPPIIPVTFSTELNVGGKYIYGASKGGWKPDQAGYFRITFYIPDGSGISFANAEIGNAAEFVTNPDLEARALADAIALSDDGGGAATPFVDKTNNLTYVDVLVVSGGGGGGGKPKKK